jgi:hypothetical protein
MSTYLTSLKSFAATIIAALVLSALPGIAAAGVPSINSVPPAVLAGSSFKVLGSGFTPGSVVNFFVSTNNGPLNEGPLKPSAGAATSLTVKVPAEIPLAQGVVALQVVNTDQGYAASKLVYALLEGSASAGIPSLTAINAVGLAATSTDPSYAIDNVETVVPQGSDVTLQGTGFDTVNGVAVDLFCACEGGKVGPFFINPGNPALSATAVTVSLPAMGPYAQPVGPASFVVSNRGIDGKYSRKSNAVSVPIGHKISVIGITQKGTKLIIDGTGFSTLTVINFYATRAGAAAVNLGGLTTAGAAAIAINLVSDTELTFNVPADAAAGPAYVQALNPPFIPFSSSGNNPNGAFILVDTTATATATASATPTPVLTPIGAPSATPTAAPTSAVPSPKASSTGLPSATPSATPAVVAEALLAGGSDNTIDASGNHPTLASAEVYNEATGAFSPTGSMAYPRLGHTATMLHNGKILVAGGHNGFSKRAMPSAELYDVKTGSFSFTGSMNSARLGHAAIVLKNGMVLVSGGMNVDFSVVNLAELYDPASGQFSPTGSLMDARMGHTATMLKDGSILVAGGANDSGLLASAELFNASGTTNVTVGPMGTPRQNATATLLGNGKVLITGGAANTASCTGCATDTAEIYNPATATFAPTGKMHSSRRGHSATLLPDGRVLIAGGVDDAAGTALDSTEIYNPATATFTPAAPMHLARFDHAAITLYDGKVLFAGGSEGSSTITNSAEIYDPAKGTFKATGAMTDSRADAGTACFESGSAGSKPSSRGVLK